MPINRFNKTVNGELGGPSKGKLISVCIFIGIWCCYLLFSTLEAYCLIPGFQDITGLSILPNCPKALPVRLSQYYYLDTFVRSARLKSFSAFQFSKIISSQETPLMTPLMSPQIGTAIMNGSEIVCKKKSEKTLPHHFIASDQFP